MLSYSSCYEGTPARLYRAPDEIRRDIRKVRREIEEINDQVSIRELLMEILSGCAPDDPERCIPELREILDAAEESLEELRKLSESLVFLEEELRETLCVLR